MKEKGVLVIRYTNEQVETAYNEWEKNIDEVFNGFFSNAI